VAAIGVVVSHAFLREPTHKIKIWDEVGCGAPPLVPDALGTSIGAWEGRGSTVWGIPPWWRWRSGLQGWLGMAGRDCL
jgi:hypothetical protein